MSMKLGAQHSHIELTRKSFQKASRQQQRIVLQVIYFTCNKEIRKQLLGLYIQLWQYFMTCNQTLLFGRYQLALPTVESTRSVSMCKLHSIIVTRAKQVLFILKLACYKLR
ncbi:hypothetical protein DINM_007243 [Dirofilaria immitis]|nr:hypothetical protein [Dirofilaria immitis]